jgi:hypothetical protein
MFLLSCNREYSASIQNGLEMRTHSLNRLKKDTSALTVEFYNVSSDTLIFPYQNSKYNVVAEAKSSGLREDPSVTMSFFSRPCNNFIIKADSTTYGVNCCDGVRREKEKYCFLPPGQRVTYQIRMNDFFTGIEKNKIYQIKLVLHIYDDIKEACPKFWSGDIDLNTQFTINK